MITSVVGCSVTETKPVIYNHQLNEVDFKQHHKREKIDGTIDYNVESKSSKIKRVYKYSNDFKLDECLKKSDIDLQSVLIILNENSKKKLVKDNNTDHIEIYDNAEFTVEFSPCKIKEENKLECSPDFNYKYRFLFIGFASMVTSSILFGYTNLIPGLPKTNISREIIIALGQIVFQSLFLFQFDKQTIMNYAGNLMTVSLMSSLILSPVLLLSKFIPLSEFIILGWFGVTVLILFLEHFRRIKILKLPIFCLKRGSRLEQIDPSCVLPGKLTPHKNTLPSAPYAITLLTMVSE